MVKNYKKTKDKGNFLNMIDSIPEKLIVNTFNGGKTENFFSKTRNETRMPAFKTDNQHCTGNSHKSN